MRPCHVRYLIEVFDGQSAICPLTSLLYHLYWSWDPLSSIGSNPVSMQVPKQVDYIQLLLLLFFSALIKVGSN